MRGPLETCPGCRITLAVPGAIAAARAGDLDRAAEYETAAEWLADVVMRLPGLGRRAARRSGATGRRPAGEPGRPSHFAAAAAGFRNAGQPLDEERCLTLADRSLP